jgi:predicted RNA binding protein with dsRBD fold (UPF0201 family)
MVERSFPIYIPVSEYSSRTYEITPQIYNLQLERLKLIRDMEEQSVYSGEEKELTNEILDHLSELIVGKKILENPRKLIGQMPVCFIKEGKFNFYYGDEEEAGSSIVMGINPSCEARNASQRIIDLLLPEVGVRIFEEEELLELLLKFKRFGFSLHGHLKKWHLDEDCDEDCLVGYHSLPTLVPGILFSVEVKYVEKLPKIDTISLFFAQVRYQEQDSLEMIKP